MRLHSAGISLREVRKDTILDSTYCLKKGAMIVMPTISIHTDSRIWGPDALSFKHDRFLFDEATGYSERKGLSSRIQEFRWRNNAVPWEAFRHNADYGLD